MQIQANLRLKHKISLSEVSERNRYNSAYNVQIDFVDLNELSIYGIMQSNKPSERKEIATKGDSYLFPHATHIFWKNKKTVTISDQKCP